MRNRPSNHTTELENAHTLLSQGKRDEAYTIVSEILEETPNDSRALALRDRMDSEDNSAAISRDRVADAFEDEDVSPWLPKGLLIISAVSACVAIYLSIKPIKQGLAQGFSSQVEMSSRLFGKSYSPVHFQLLTPALLLIISGMCIYGWRRYTKK